MYDAKDFVVQMGSLQGFPAFPYGSYRFEIISSKTHENGTNEMMACFRAFIDIQEKRKKILMKQKKN